MKASRSDTKPVWVPVSENFLHPKTVGNYDASSAKKYFVADLPNQYYERMKYENS
jgi:hypothetical protein